MKFNIVRLQGQTAVIAGGSRGIGRAVASAFAREGARLVIAARNQRLLRRAGEELALQTDVHTVRADVSRAADVRRLFNFVRRRLGTLDILVNAAGMAEARPVAETSDQLWEETIGANLTAPFLCCRQGLGLMLPRKKGHIVNVVSVAALEPFALNSAYCAAKAGALAFTRVLREELRGSGIRVTALIPGATNTGLWDRLWPEAPREKMMQAADIAEAALAAVLMPESAVAEEIVLRPMAGRL